MNRFDVRYMQLVEEKLLAIINKENSATAVAEELNVTRQTVYTWKSRYERFGIDWLVKFRKRRTDTPHNKIAPETEQLVINTAGTYWTDGVEALSDHLARLYNLSINPTTVYRILKRCGIRYGEYHPRTTKRWKITPNTWSRASNGYQIPLWIQTRTSVSIPSSMMLHAGYMHGHTPLRMLRILLILLNR